MVRTLLNLHAKILEATYANDEEEVVRIEKELKTIRPREAELKAIEDKLKQSLWRVALHAEGVV